MGMGGDAGEKGAQTGASLKRNSPNTLEEVMAMKLANCVVKKTLQESFAALYILLWSV